MTDIKIFPSLSDSSYLKVDDDYESIDALGNNFPNWEKIYNIPIKEIKNLNIPVVNFGNYGKGSYLYTEEGKKVLDFASGVAVCNVGYNSELVNRVVIEQKEAKS